MNSHDSFGIVEVHLIVEEYLGRFVSLDFLLSVSWIISLHFRRFKFIWDKSLQLVVLGVSHCPELLHLLRLNLFLILFLFFLCMKLIETSSLELVIWPYITSLGWNPTYLESYSTATVAAIGKAETDQGWDQKKDV